MSAECFTQQAGVNWDTTYRPLVKKQNKAKTILYHMQTVKVQISMRMRIFWSEPPWSAHTLQKHAYSNI